MKLTKSQQEALALDKNISVIAGAGSGKTRILVDRFLKITFINPELTRHIVAITFTEKAAAEMQERIAEEVSNRLKKENNTSQDRKKLQYIRDHISSAHISTIHGFCLRLLQEFPVEAGVTPDFSILEPIRQQVLLYQAIELAMSELDKSMPVDAEGEWVALFSALSRKRIVEVLKVSLEKPYELKMITDSFRARSKEEYIQFLTGKWMSVINNLITVEELKNIFNLCSRIIDHDTVELKGDQAAGLNNTLKLFYQAFNNNPDSPPCYDALLKVTDAFTKKDGTAYSNISYLGKKENWAKEVHSDVLYLSELLAPVQKRLKQTDPGSMPDETDEKWYDLFTTFLKLQQRSAVLFSQIKLDQGVLDFEDLQLFTLKLLQENEDIRQKLQARFRYIMVDEFQDTNPVQWRIVQLLSLINQRMATDQLFIVGDPKQSIYGFRDADIRIFKNVVQSISHNAGHMFGETYEGNITFRESFRFLPKVNAFINHFFSTILQADSDSPFEVSFEPLQAERKLPDKGAISLTVLDEENPQQSETEFIALKIKELINSQAAVYEIINGEEKSRPARCGDIAILIRDRSALSDIEFALREQNIPFKTVGGIGFWQRQEIYDIYHALRFLSNPADDLALVAILRSRLFLLPDSVLFFMSDNKGSGYLEKLRLLSDDDRLNAEEKLGVKNACILINNWLKLRERITLSELIDLVINDTRLFAVLNAEFSGEQRTANLQKVIELADSFDQSGPGGMYSFLSIIDDLINREVTEGEAFLALDDKDSVKIMTIHVSKGLEFPIVFTPFLNKQMRGPSGDVMLDHELGLAVTFKSDDENTNSSSNENTLYRLLRIRQMQKDLAEEKRIFYVAVSRARDYLFMSATVKKQSAKANSKFSWLNDCLVRQAKSPYFDDVLTFEEFELITATQYEKRGQGNNSSQATRKLLEQLANDKKVSPYQGNINVVEPVKGQTYSRTFSATALMTFIRNPDEYYHHYHLGFFEGDYKQTLIEKSDDIDSLLKGKIVHRFLEIINKDSQNPSSILEKILFDFEIYDTDIKNQLNTELLAVYHKMQESPQGRKILSAKEYKNEISLTMQLGSDFFTGTIDRLQKNDDNEWEIYDYKTNRITQDQLQNTAEEYDIQIKSYALLLAHFAPLQKSYVISFYFLSVDSFFQKPFSKDDINSIKQEFLGIVNQIKEKFPIN